MFLLSMCFVTFNFCMTTVLNWRYKHLAPLGAKAAATTDAAKKDIASVEIEMEPIELVGV